MHLKRLSFKAKLQKAAQVNPLTFIQYGGVDSNILGFETEAVSSVSPLLQGYIRNLKDFASQNRFVGLSAIQAGYAERIFILSKEVRSASQDSAMTNTWQTDIEYPSDSFTAFINPKIIEIRKEVEAKREVSASFPMLEATVSRYTSIRVRYFNEEMEEEEADLDGFESRTFQHFQDLNMNKHLLNWRVSHDQVNLLKKDEQQFKRFASGLEDYRNEVRKMKQEFPNLFMGRSISELNKACEHLQMASFEVDMGRRLLRNIRKDMNLDVTKLELDQLMGV